MSRYLVIASELHICLKQYYRYVMLLWHYILFIHPSRIIYKYNKKVYIFFLITL